MKIIKLKKLRKYMRLMATAGMVVISALIFAASPAYAKNVNCNQGHSLQDAVDTTVDGGVIEVSGTCNEVVFVNNDGVQIVGVGGAIVVAPPNANSGTFTVRGRRVIIRGFTIRGRTGVAIVDGGSAVVQNNIIDDVTSTGITVQSSSYGRIQFNEVISNGFAGILLFNSASGDIAGNSVTTPNGSGIAINGGSSAIVSGNTVHESFRGMQVAETSYIFFPGGNANTFDSNNQGVTCEHDSVIRVDEEQSFINNVQDGVQFNGCTIRNFVGAPFPLP